MVVGTFCRRKEFQVDGGEYILFWHCILYWCLVVGGLTVYRHLVLGYVYNPDIDRTARIVAGQQHEHIPRMCFTIATIAICSS